MPRFATATVCSRAKSTDTRPLMACRRYTGTHIALVEARAKREHDPFFLLSGVHGFIAAEYMIPHYDHELVESEVSALVMKVAEQLRSERLDLVEFYAKVKPSWALYIEVMRTAALRVGVRFNFRHLPCKA
jgi:hypothetical protein